MLTFVLTWQITLTLCLLATFQLRRLRGYWCYKTTRPSNSRLQLESHFWTLFVTFWQQNQVFFRGDLGIFAVVYVDTISSYFSLEVKPSPVLSQTMIFWGTCSSRGRECLPVIGTSLVCLWLSLLSSCLLAWHPLPSVCKYDNSCKALWVVSRLEKRCRNPSPLIFLTLTKWFFLSVNLRNSNLSTALWQEEKIKNSTLTND